jgi:carbon monoxide dehydrogenase subunit G
MKITQEIQVASSAESVYRFFQDVPAVAQCLPGAKLTEDRGDGTYKGTVSVRLGPMTAGFEGEATVTSDPDTMTGHMTGKGVDRRGGSRGQVKVNYAVSATDEGSMVSVDADITISGAAAQFGRTGLLNQISQRLINEFVRCIEAKLQAEDETSAAEISAGEVKGISLVASTVGSEISSGVKKLFKKG